MAIRLLARNIRSGLGKTLHVDGKGFMRWAVNHLAEKKIQKVIKYKKKEGWIYPEVGQLYADITEIIEMEKFSDGPNGRNGRFFRNFRDVLCVTLDEDSYYVLRFFALLDAFYRNEKKYRIEEHKKRPYWNIGKKMQEGSIREFPIDPDNILNFSEFSEALKEEKRRYNNEQNNSKDRRKCARSLRHNIQRR